MKEFFYMKYLWRIPQFIDFAAVISRIIVIYDFIKVRRDLVWSNHKKKNFPRPALDPLGTFFELIQIEVRKWKSVSLVKYRDNQVAVQMEAACAV